MGKNLDGPVDADTGDYVDYTIDLTAGTSTAPLYKLYSIDADKDVDTLSPNSRLPTTWDTIALANAGVAVNVDITKEGSGTFGGSCTMTQLSKVRADSKFSTLDDILYKSKCKAVGGTKKDEDCTKLPSKRK